MKLLRIKFSFKLFLLFIFFSILPLIVVALIVFQRVEQSYTKTLEESFKTNAQTKQQILQLFLESNRSWIRTIASQDLLLDALTNPQTEINQKVFASLTSIRRENPYIERVYIINPKGEIIISTANNDLGIKTEDLPFLTIPLKERVPYVGKIILSPYKKRVIPLSAPLIRKSDNTPIGVIVMELNSSIIKALFEGKLYSQLLQQDNGISGPQTYIVDDNGILLTPLINHTSDNLSSIFPVSECVKNNSSVSGNWKSYNDKDVIGVSQCVKFDGLVWTLVIEQDINDVFAVSRQLGSTILIITFLVGTVLFFLIASVSKSITIPLKELEKGAQLLGTGDLDYRIKLKTGDELENLAKSFNEMAAKLKSVIWDLRQEKEILEDQKTRLDKSANLLLRRDFELRQIYEEVELEKEMAEAERNKLEVVLKGITDGVIAVDLKRRIIIFNPASENITGFKSEKVIGKYLNEVIKVYDNNEVGPEIYCPILTNDFEGVIYSKEYLKIKGYSEKSTDVHLIVGKIREGVSINLGAILTFHDVTKEQELERMKLDFVSMAAHELRTPLTSVMGYASLLQSEIAHLLDQEHKNYLHRLVIAAKNLGNLIDNLLNASRIEKGVFKVDLRPIDLTETIETAVNNLKEIANSKKVNLAFNKLSDKLPIVMADSFRISEVITNLITNALSHSDSGGKVWVSVNTNNQYFECAVNDAGTGIPQEAIPKLFTKFFRVSGALEQGSKGTGLGLYITKTIIDLHKGQISVNSVLDKGSTFTFRLPIASEQDIQDCQKNTKETPISNLGKNGILINKERIKK